MRWPVKLFLRTQFPDLNSAGLIELPDEIEQLHACIEPIRAMTFWSSVNANGPDAPTHIIETRWNDYIDQRHAFVRQTSRPDGSRRIEIFRVRRALGDLDGRKRRSRYECQLESLQ